MSIKTYHLNKAFQSLNKAMIRAEEDLEDLEVRDACIQRFKYNYELVIQLIKKYIKEYHTGREEVESLICKDLLRIAAQIGLIENVETLKKQLKKFEKKHSKEIKDNKDYYQKINRVRDELGLPEEVGVYEWRESPSFADPSSGRTWQCSGRRSTDPSP